MSLTSPVAEQIVIGCCLQACDVSHELAGLRVEHFAIEANRIAFAEIIAAWSRGVPLDPVSLDDALRNRIQQVADLGYWVECAEAGYSRAMLPAHVATLKSKALRRALSEAANQIAALAHDEGDIRAHVASASALVGAIVDGTVTKGPRHIADVLRDHVPNIGERWDGKQTGLMTGFHDLDGRIGGMRPGNLVLVAARPAMGKTSFAMQIGARAAQSGVVVAFSQEMADTELADRLIAFAAKLPLSKVIKGELSADEYDRFAHGVGSLQKLGLYVDDSPAQRITDIRAKVMQVKRKHEIAAVVVDYLQLMSGDGESRNAEIEKISRGLKALAKELSCPVIALSQLSRKCEDRPNKRPMLSDLRDSGAIEQDADIVLMIYRDEVYNPDSPDAGTAEILIRKNRQGQTGDVRLTWLGEYTAFADCAYQQSRVSQEQPQKRRRGFDD